MLADRGDFAIGEGKKVFLNVAASYLNGFEHDLIILPGKVVLERLTPSGIQREVKPDSRLTSEVMAAGVHDFIGDKPLALDSGVDLSQSFAGYRCRVTVFARGLFSGGLEVSFRVLNSSH